MAIFKTLLNKFNFVLGAIAGGIVFISLSPLILLSWPFLLWNHKKTETRLQEFLLKNDGLELFVYTSRKNSRQYLEHKIIPHFAGRFQLVFLDGRKPTTPELDESMVSLMLYRLTNIGFPSVVKISNGMIHNVSLKREFHDIRNQKRNPEEFVEAVIKAASHLEGIQ